MSKNAFPWVILHDGRDLVILLSTTRIRCEQLCATILVTVLDNREWQAKHTRSE